MSLFFSSLCSIITVFSLYVECVLRFFHFRMVFFYLVTTGWIFDINLVCGNSINVYRNNTDIVHIILMFY